MKNLFTICLLCLSIYTQAQPVSVADPEELNSASLEDLSESDDGESEDDYEIQQLLSYQRNPLNLNSDEEALNNFPLLDPLLVNNLTKYRSILGNLINVYELQAVPGFTTDIIKKIFPYVTVSDDHIHLQSVKDRFAGGTYTYVVRPSYTPEKADGFKRDASAANHFIGARPSLFMRFKYQYRNLLQYGFTADKDVGEPFTTRQVPFFTDFNSFHFFMRNCGWLKSLSIGDYTVNVGQGLIHWQSQAFKKSSGVINIKRQSETLRPYQSAGEYNFHRGLAATLLFRRFELTLFGSYRKLSANLDSNEINGRVITSLLTSGYHRSNDELKDKNTVALLLAGGIIKWLIGRGHISLNTVAGRYSLPVSKKDEPYNLYALKGKSWNNSSVSYTFTVRNLHFFGEAACDAHKYPAVVSGMLASLNAFADAALLYRNIHKGYQAPYGNAFTENTLPTNEKGFYTGFSLKPAYMWKLDFYADAFSFPWMKYRTFAPSSGLQYLVQVTWKPVKPLEIYSRFRFRMKPLDTDADEEVNYPEQHILKNWRTQVSYQVTRAILLRNRVETCTFQPSPGEREKQGYLFYTDLVYKPVGKSYSANLRLQRFETEGYDTRLYAYENDLMLVSSVPAFFDKGSRYYFNFKMKTPFKPLRHSQLTFSLKLASTFFAGKNEIGLGPLTIHGSRKTDIKLQILVSFGS